MAFPIKWQTEKFRNLWRSDTFFFGAQNWRKVMHCLLAFSFYRSSHMRQNAARYLWGQSVASWSGSGLHWWQVCFIHISAIALFRRQPPWKKSSILNRGFFTSTLHPCPSCNEDPDMMRHNHPSLGPLTVQSQVNNDGVCPVVRSHVIHGSNVKFAHRRAERIPQTAPFTCT